MNTASSPSEKVKVNGVWRDVNDSHTKVNGVWRMVKTKSVKVNGVWRELYMSMPLSLDNIKGFHLNYTLNAERKYPKVPRLKYNSEIPYMFKVTGESQEMDLTTKGVVFEYQRDKPNSEGIIMYEGRLYAEIFTGEWIQLCGISSLNLNSEQKNAVTEICSIHEENSVVPNNINIDIDGYALFEDYGYYFAGWNNIFNTTPVIDPTIYPDKKEYKMKHQLDSYPLYPINLRDKQFDCVATIGVARDMFAPIENMVGSYGLLDHTIKAIKVNGTPMPFKVSIG